MRFGKARQQSVGNAGGGIGLGLIKQAARQPDLRLGARSGKRAASSSP